MNRGFAYGDGFFETVRIVDNMIPLLRYHLHRAKKTAKFLELRWPNSWDYSFFSELILKNRSEDENVARLDFYRHDGGLYTPESDKIDYSVSFRKVSDLSTTNFLLDGNWWGNLKSQKKIPTYVLQSWQKPCTPLSCIKSTSALFYVKAALIAKRNSDLQNIILLNEHGRICEGLSQNVFYLKDNQWYGIPLTEGPIDGVYSSYFKSFVDVIETPTTLKALESADFIVLTNAVKGLVSISLVR